MSSVSGNSWIDDELKNVAIPTDLTAKLRAIPSLATPSLATPSLATPSLDDTQLDCALNDVRISAVDVELLRERLGAIGSLDHQDLDDELRHVVLPFDLRAKLLAIADEPAPGLVGRFAARLIERPTVHWLSVNIRPLAIAASLLVAAGVGYLTAIMATNFARGDRDATGPGGAIAGINISDSGRSGNIVETNQPARDRVLPRPVSDSALAGNKNSTDAVVSRPIDQQPTASGGNQPARDAVVGVPASGSSRASGSPSSIERVATSLEKSPDGANRVPEAPFGGVPGVDELPLLRSVQEPVWRGITPPRVRGYDLTFQLRHGVHPFVSPATNKTLETSQVPVVTSTASFDLAVQSVSQRKLPPAYRIRTEEFLAAMDYQFAPPAANKPLAIRTAAGPSPWGSNSAATPGLSLMQVGVQAGTLPRDANSGTHLVLILDGSVSMQAEQRWQTAVRGLSHFVRQMAPRDRVSLIVFGDKSQQLADRVTAKEMPAVLRKLEQLVPVGSGDFAAALQLAVKIAKPIVSEDKKSAADKDTQNLSARIVLMTDGLMWDAIGASDDATDSPIEQTLAAAVADGARLDVIDIREEETLDSQLGAIAAAGRPGGAPAGMSSDSATNHVRHAGTADRIRWELLEVLTDRSQIIAADVSIKVMFKPDAVAMYRLLGHEATSVVGLMSNGIEADLRSGEAATGLYEVALTPDGGPTVAVVEVSWLDTKTGNPQTMRQTISRVQFATSMVESPFSLQLAAMAAETAEVLRDSYFAPPNAHSLADVADLGRQLNVRLRSRPSYVRLMALLEQAQRSQPVGN